MTLMLLSGPLYFDYANSIGNFPKLELNSNSWTKGTHSYAKNSEAYNCSDTLSVTLTYDFLRKWLMDHPEYLKNPPHVSGDSYADIFVALLSHKIYDGIEVGDKPRMNIKDYIQGNALTDRYINVNDRVKYANHMGLISDKIYQVRCNESMHYRGMKRTESYVYDVQSAIDDHQHLTRKSCRALIYRYKVKYSQNDYELTYATVKELTGSLDTISNVWPSHCVSTGLAAPSTSSDKSSNAYFLWCISIPSFDRPNSIPKKNLSLPRSFILKVLVLVPQLEVCLQSDCDQPASLQVVLATYDQ
ncbi:hypothetical protein BC332_23541 [Capsicum chinense]|nr:hypothetical protein BC332_23541 [Capsicum chinense]